MNTSHYPSIELCKELTELGFPKTEKRHEDSLDGVTRIFYRCPSLMEMLDFLPREKNGIPLTITYDAQGSPILGYSRSIEGCCISDTIPNALAHLTILHLKSII